MVQNKGMSKDAGKIADTTPEEGQLKEEHKPWPPAPAPALPLDGMNGDHVTLNDPVPTPPPDQG